MMISFLRPVAAKMITSIMALVLALGMIATSAVPVRAQTNSDAVKVIAGIAALAAVGAFVNDRNDRRDAERRRHDRHDQWDRHERPRGHYQPPRHARPGPPPHAKAHGWHKKHPQASRPTHSRPSQHSQTRPRPSEPNWRF